MSRDSHGRSIDYLRISVTDRCNMRCVYCMPREGVRIFPHAEMLSYEEILTVTRILARMGVRKVRLTGGEPLIRRDITYLIKNLHAIPEIQDIALTTNGVLLPAMLEELTDAGLMRVNISLDTLRPDRFKAITGNSSLSTVRKAINLCLEKNLLPLKINVVVIRGLNDNELIDFARLAEHHELNVRFIEFMPWGNHELWNRDKVISSADIRVEIEKTFGSMTECAGCPSGPSRDYTIQGFKGTIGFINPISEHFCEMCNRLRLTADGMLRLCLFSEKEINLKKTLRNGASEEDLSRILASAIQEKPASIDLKAHLMKHARQMSQIGG